VPLPAARSEFAVSTGDSSFGIVQKSGVPLDRPTADITRDHGARKIMKWKPRTGLGRRQPCPLLLAVLRRSHHIEPASTMISSARHPVRLSR
jgi:hypothetical protein